MSESESDDRPWNEAKWERFMLASDVRSAKFGELLETLIDDPNCDEIIAREMGSEIRVTSGPVLEKQADLAGLLTNLGEGDVLFIDEIHRLSNVVEEYLYPALEDFRLDIMLDRGAAARSVQLTLPRFTLVGATTRAGLLTAR